MSWKSLFLEKIVDKRARESLLFIGKLLSHGTENIVGESICVSETVWYEMILWIRRCEVYVEIVLSHSTERFGRGTLLCFRKFTEAEKFKDKRWRGACHEIPSKLLCLTLTKLFCRGTLQCFRNFLVSEIFIDKTRDRITTFRRKVVVSRYRKTLWGNPSVFQKQYGMTWIYGWEGVNCTSKLFCRTVPKLLVEERFCGSETIWFANILWI